MPPGLPAPVEDPGDPPPQCIVLSYSVPSCSVLLLSDLSHGSLAKSYSRVVGKIKGCTATSVVISCPGVGNSELSVNNIAFSMSSSWHALSRISTAPALRSRVSEGTSLALILQPTALHPPHLLSCPVLPELSTSAALTATCSSLSLR